MRVAAAGGRRRLKTPGWQTAPRQQGLAMHYQAGLIRRGIFWLPRNSFGMLRQRLKTGRVS